MRDGIFIEDKNSPYVNIIVTREDNKDAENVKAFIHSYQSPEVAKAAGDHLQRRRGARLVMTDTRRRGDDPATPG